MSIGLKEKNNYDKIVTRLPLEDLNKMTVGTVEYNTCFSQDHSITLSYKNKAAVIIRSTARVTCGTETFSVKPNTAIIMSENTEKSITGNTCDPIVDFFEFVPDENDGFIRSLNITENTPLFGYDTFQLSDCIYIMKNEELEQKEYAEDMRLLCVTRFFILLKRLIDTGIHVYPHRLDRLREMIKNMPDKQWTVEEMVDIAGMSKRQFYNSYLHAFGNSPQQEIINSRIEYAKYLIDTTEMRIAEIATACNYKSVEHFSRIFKKKTGISPNHYKKRVDRKKYVNFIRRTYISPYDEE